MKKAIYILFITTIIILSGCKSTTYLQIMRPAAVTVPQNIKAIALVNRTVPEKKGLNIIEGVLTGEGIGQDREGVQKAMDGLSQVLEESPRFTVKRTTEALKNNFIAGGFTNPIPWPVIGNICRRYETDAVLALEIFDSDFVTTHASKVVEKKDSDGNVRKVTEYNAEGVASVKIGYRLYDLSTHTITDQQEISQNHKWSASGNSVKDALAHLLERRIAVNNVSYQSGRAYAQRIAPSWFTASRVFYKKSKKNPNLALGARQAAVGNWEEAAETWKQVLNNADMKTAGKAAYNIALSYEVIGDLQSAKEWASDAYATYNNKKARDYSRILDRRIWEQDKLDQQMNNQ